MDPLVILLFLSVAAVAKSWIARSYLHQEIGALQVQLRRADATILELRKNGWTTLEEDERRRKLPPRGKGGRFLSKDDALRAQGFPVDFARAMGKMDAESRQLCARRGDRYPLPAAEGEVPEGCHGLR